MKSLTKMGLLSSALLMSLPVSADWDDNITINGFGSLIATSIISGKNNPGFEEYYLPENDCPCYITDYYFGALIDENESFNLKNESKIGVQLGVTLTDSLNFTSQVVARTYNNELSLEWAYLTYNLSDEWSLQAGRKRIPLYYFSTFQDVGYAYTWVRPPQSLYGWEASNYNGANIYYNGTVGDVSIMASAFLGSETVEDAGINKLYTDDISLVDDARWDDITGFDFELTYEWFNARIIYLTSDNYSTDKFSGDYGFRGIPTEQTVSGLAVNGDFGDWFFHLESSENERNVMSEGYTVKAPAEMVALGMRFGSWTPMLSWSRYWEESDDDTYEAERFIIRSLTLRYDINSQNALKFQLEQWDDSAQYDYVGDTTVLSISYDFLF